MTIRRISIRIAIGAAIAVLSLLAICMTVLLMDNLGNYIALGLLGIMVFVLLFFLGDTVITVVYEFKRYHKDSKDEPLPPYDYWRS